MRAAPRLAGLLAAIPLFAPSLAWATYSIAAVDLATGEVGGAGASCVGNLDVSIIYGAVPGVGVVHAQARLHLPGRDRAVALLAMGRTPEEIIAELTRPAFDARYRERQYGVVTLLGAAAGFTGDQTGPWAGHQTGRADPFVFAVQGNLLTGTAVIAQTEAGFAGCDLADRLMQALEAGRANGQGDARCTPRGVPSDAAFLRVDPPAGGAPVVSLSVQATGNQDPVAAIRRAYDQWRAGNPCPAPPDAGVEPETDAGVPDAAVPDASAEDASAEDASAEDASAEDAQASPADAAASPVADAGLGAAGTGATGACGCKSGGAGGRGLGLLATLTLLVARRGSRRPQLTNVRARGSSAPSGSKPTRTQASTSGSAGQQSR